MKKFLRFKGIFIFIGILSIILVPATLSVNQETFASHVPNHTNCTNWEGRLDTDCDGLADTWENLGYYEKNGIHVDLPAGIYFKHRDVLVEIDYMGHHEPTVTSLDRVKAKFDAMTGLDNPDGSTGVRLHYIKSDNIPHKTCINIWSDSDGDLTNDFDNIKKTWMGSTSSPSNYYQAAKDVYHYFLFIHTRCGTTEQQQSAGVAEGPGNDGVVSLGYPGWGNIINGHDTGSNDYKSRAFAHEIGHNLGLRHGGSADAPHCKPNYISVMNYLFEFPTKIPAAAADFDYSKNVIPELDERALLEWVGIGPSWPNGLPTGVGHSSWTHTVPHVWQTTANNAPINYNWYRTTSNDFDDIVDSSITNFHFAPCDDDDITNSQYNGRLWGFNDIHYNSLTFWALSGGSQNSTGVPNTEASTELPNALNKTSISFANKLLNNSLANVTNGTSISAVNELPYNSLANVTNGTSQFNLGVPSYLMDLSNLSNDSISEIVAVPCDMTGDPHCDPNGHEFVQDLSEDYGNRTIPDEELTLNSVLTALSDNADDVWNYINNTKDGNWTDGIDVKKAKKDLKKTFLDGPDSIKNDTKGKEKDSIEKALKKLSDERQKFDVYSGNETISQNQTIKQYLKVRDEGLLNLIDGYSALLEKKR